jgi:hypothetical protein
MSIDDVPQKHQNKERTALTPHLESCMVHLMMRCGPDIGERAEKLAVHAYVQANCHLRFEAYLKEVGLTSGSALLTLLILREIELRLLRPSAGLAAAQESRSKKVSAYIQTDHAERFRAHVDALGRSNSDCAAELIERELDERWLKAALIAAPEVRP